MKILLIIHNCNSPYNIFPCGLAYLASVIRNEGHSCTIFDQATTHKTNDQLISHIQSEGDYDFIGMGFQAAYFHTAFEIAKAIKKVSEKTPLILGGSAPSASPEYFLRKFNADYVLTGESENSIVKFLDVIKQNAECKEVDGLFWKENIDIHSTQKGEPPKDLDAIPFPAWDLFDMKSYTFPRRLPGVGHIVMPIGMVTTRGCPYSCKFCFRLEKSFRKRSIESCIEEIKYLLKTYNINYIAFLDELFIFSKQRTLKFCESILNNDLSFNWSCTARFNIADREQLHMMKKAGCVVVSYGLESGDQKILDEMDKKITVEQILEISAITKEEGLLVSVPSMFGLPGEDAQSLQKTVDAVIEATSWHDKRTLRPMQPYPGSYYFDYCIKKGLLKNEDDFFSRFFSSEKWTVNLTDIPDSEFDHYIFEANKYLLKNYYDNLFKNDLKMFQKVYFSNNRNNFIPMR
ncbi:radical SAM protein [Candidatus Magnetomorum sp. HK-1]|nr:radical SAM protein [Candidatus Magnetomorum sp. HK-1]